MKENVEEKIKGAWVRKIEEEHAFNYLNNYSENVNNGRTVPLLVDILNCEHGCNIGTGTCIERIEKDKIIAIIRGVQ
ncbi:hypothetical protein [Clostridium grantii]|uniref:Uncharacterized protein n=1 Tax=Clostridium grantii DSM 8605 TaxID=1121316 RepID=A0A1M5XVE7_9CLOT|nr:hypothetical protein [Clostridium grantii]SHI03801.1 hypothetical protein SAMN02745207_03969 [Clostridium grantii DSM 8605]